MRIQTGQIDSDPCSFGSATLRITQMIFIQYRYLVLKHFPTNYFRHPFFGDLDWTNMQNMAPPHVPQVPGTYNYSVPDPGGSGFKSPGWIRFRIRNPDPFPASEIEL